MEVMQLTSLIISWLKAVKLSITVKQNCLCSFCKIFGYPQELDENTVKPLFASGDLTAVVRKVSTVSVYISLSEG